MKKRFKEVLEVVSIFGLIILGLLILATFPVFILIYIFFGWNAQKWLSKTYEVIIFGKWVT